MDAQNLPQPMRPHGLQGRIFGVLMERLSASNYAWVVKQLKPLKPKSYLEIGFGTGRLAELVARKFKPLTIVGIDPSELMIDTARKRLRRFSRKTKIELKDGDDTLLASLAGPFDAIVAAHAFQFWSDPAATLARIHGLLAPSGALVLVLRKHAAKAVGSWIPNPITKSGDELGGTRQALASAGFRIAVDEKVRTGSQGVVAVHT